MGPQEDYIETVFTCEGDINDPNLQSRLEDFRRVLRDLLSTDKRKLILKKVEPWNSVRVTFNIPREAARRLKQLAQQGNSTLKQLGVLAVQIEGDQLISLTIAGRNNEPTRFFFHTSDTVDAASMSVIDTGGTNEFQSPGSSNAETTKKNIENYLRQQGAPLFDSIFGQNNSTSDVFSNSSEALGQVGSYDALKAPSHTGNGGNSLQGPQNTLGLGRSQGEYQAQSSFIGSGNNPTGHHGLKLPSPTSGGISQPGQNELSLPPPPPYPQGSAMLNNFAKAGRFGGTSTTSPLLVNLLQNEPSLAGINNFMNNKMLPPPEASPPPKKKRKPRKPKDKTNKPIDLQSQQMASHQGVSSNPGTGEGEISIQSVPNPALTPTVTSCSVPLVTSGSSSNMPTIPMVTQALPATTQPVVTFSSQGRQPVHLPHSPTYHPEAAGLHVITTATKIPSSQEPSPRKSESGDLSPFLPENTAGKIINPYTGLLEPMDNLSDTSPNKSDSSLEGFSPHKSTFKRSPKDRTHVSFTPNLSSVNNNSFHQGQVKSDRISSVPITASGLQGPEHSRQPIQQNISETVSNNHSSGNENLMIPSMTSSSTVASSVSRNINTNVHSSQRKESALPVTSLQNTAPQTNKSADLFGTDRVMKTEFVNVSRQQDYTAGKSSTLELMTANKSSDYVSVSNVSLGTNTSVALSTAAGVTGRMAGLSPASMMQPQLQPLYRTVHKSVTSSLNVGYHNDLNVSAVCCVAHTVASNTHQTVSHKQQPVLARQQKLVTPELSSPHSANSEHLLNPHHVMNHPAKNSSVLQGASREVDSPGGDSENSSQSSLLHDQQVQNDIAAACPLESETKVYNHDSGIGSSSERSDGTPSEPGDDFKAGHTSNSEECGAPIKHFLDGINKSCIPKSDSQVITVGYAMSDGHVNKDSLKHNTTDISSMLSMSKTLNHPYNNCHVNKNKVINNVDPNHQMTVLHWSTKDKILSNQVESNKRKSPKQFLREDNLSQVSSDNKRSSQYTAKHLQHMQNLIKLDSLPAQAVEYAQQFGDGRPGVGGLSISDFTANLKDNINRRSPFSSLAHQVEVSRTSPQHMVNNHVQGRGSPRVSEPFGRASPRINEPIPRVSVSQMDDNYVMCNNDHSVSQLIHPASRPSVMGSTASSAIQVSMAHTGIVSTVDSTRNLSPFINQKLFPRSPHPENKARSPSNVVNTALSEISHTRTANVENVLITSTIAGTVPSSNTAMITGPNLVSSVGSVVCLTDKLQDNCQQNCDDDEDENDDVSIVSVSQVSKADICAGKPGIMSTGMDLPKSVSSSSCLSVTAPPSSVQYNKRRSPVNSTINSLPQHFFDPALPLAKRLTESIQKLVKPMDPSSLPHSQHKSPGGTSGATAKTSAVSSPPRPIRDNRVSVTEAYANAVLPTTDITSVNSLNPHKTSHEVNTSVSIETVTASQNLVNKGPDNGMYSVSSYSRESDITAVSPLHSTQMYTNNSSISDSTKSGLPLKSLQETAATLSNNSGTNHDDHFMNQMTSNLNVNSNVPVKNKSALVETDSEIKDAVHYEWTKGGGGSRSVTLQSGSHSQHSKRNISELVSTQNITGNECNKSMDGDNRTQMSMVTPNDSGRSYQVQNSSQSVMSTASSETFASNGPIALNADEVEAELNAHLFLPPNGSENVNSSFDAVPGKQDKSPGITVEGKPFAVQDIELAPAKSAEATVSRQVNTQGNSDLTLAAQQPLHAQRLTNDTDSKPECTLFSDDSQSTMALRRTRKPSESSENVNATPQHNLRQTRQRINPNESTDKEVAKTPGIESDTTKNLRTSRRRKTNQSDNEVIGVEIGKKLATEDLEVAKHTRSADIKDTVLPPVLKNDIAKTSVEGQDLLDSVKSGLRNRTQNKPPSIEDKGKKDLKRKASEDDKRVQQNKRNRHSPTLSQEKTVHVNRDRSPMRISRTRGQTPQNSDPQEEKRSTRSSRPKDATESLPPSSKRRRSSRDHR